MSGAPEGKYDLVKKEVGKKRNTIQEQINNLFSGESIGPESNLPIFYTEFFSKELLLPYNGYQEHIKRLTDKIGENIICNTEKTIRINQDGCNKIIGIIDLTKNTDRANIEKLIQGAPIIKHSKTHAFYPHLLILENNNIINLADVGMVHMPFLDNMEEFSIESHKTASYFMKRSLNVLYFNVPLMFSLFPGYLEP